MSVAIAVCIDFKSPQAYLALAPTRALEARLGAPFDWRPLLVPPMTAPAPAMDGEDRGTRHRRIRAEYLARDLARYAASRGLELGDPHRNPDTTLAALGLSWLRRVAPQSAGDYVERVFGLVWVRGANVAEIAAIEAALGPHARGFRDYATGPGSDELAEQQRELAGAGVWMVPTYLVDGEPFLGRQHLPMIEWLATGRAGTPPI